MGKRLNQLNLADNAKDDDYLLIDSVDFVQSKKIKIKDLFKNISKAFMKNLIDGNNTNSVRQIGSKDDYQMGTDSFAEGRETSASGNASHAEGSKSSATAEVSHAEGSKTLAEGQISHAEGYQTIAGNTAAHSEGYSTVSSGQASHAEGFLTKATTTTAHSEGYKTVAAGGGSHAEGQSVQAKGQGSHSEGYYTISENVGSHAEGNGSENIYLKGEANATEYEICYGELAGLDDDYLKEKIITGSTILDRTTNQEALITNFEIRNGKKIITVDKTFSVDKPLDETGAKNTKSIIFGATGKYSHSEGFGCSATGEEAPHAEGQLTVAIGDGSHAEGTQTIAKGRGSHAEGYGTIATVEGSHIEGRYNKIDTENKYIHTIGNGEKNARSNAHTVDKNGNAWYSGEIRVGGNSFEEGISFANAFTGIASSSVVAVDDVSPVEHKVGCRVLSNLIDESKISKEQTFYWTVGKVGQVITAEPGVTYFAKVSSPLQSIAVFNAATREKINEEFDSSVCKFTVSEKIRIFVVLYNDPSIESDLRVWLMAGDYPYTPYIPDLSVVTVTRQRPDGSDSKAYTPNAEGIISGMLSLYPAMEISTDNPGAVVDVTYNKDANKTNGGDPITAVSNAVSGTQLTTTLTKQSGAKIVSASIELPSSGGKSVEVVQETGTSTTAVMSQKAVTDALASAGGIVNIDNGSLPYADEAEYQKGTLYKQGAILSTVNKAINPLAVMTASKVCDMPVYSGYCTAARIGENIYIANSRGYVAEFDPKAATAKVVYEHMARDIDNCSQCAIGSKIYFFGGAKDGVYSNQISCYNVETKEYKVLSLKLPYTLCYSATVNIGAVAYVFGGKKTDSEKPYSGIIKVDFYKNTATEIGVSMPTGLTEHCATSIGKYAYIIGGNKTEGGFSDKVYRFNSQSNTCEEYKTLLNGFVAGGCHNLGNYVLEFGGYGGTNRVYIIDTKAGTVSNNATTSLSGWYQNGAFADGNTLYLFDSAKGIYKIDLPVSYYYETIGNS